MPNQQCRLYMCFLEHLLFCKKPRAVHAGELKFSEMCRLDLIRGLWPHFMPPSADGDLLIHAIYLEPLI